MNDLLHTAKPKEDILKQTLLTSISKQEAEVVTIETLRDPEFVKEAEWCFLTTLATFVTDRVFLPEQASIIETLPDSERESVAHELGDFICKYVGVYVDQHGESSRSKLPSNEEIMCMARFFTVYLGNTFSEDKLGAFAIELQRAQNPSNNCKFIICKSNIDNEKIAGLMTFEYYPKEDSQGLYIREFMIDPWSRSSHTTRCLLEKLFEIIANDHPAVDEITVATLSQDADGNDSRTTKLYQLLGFRAVSCMNNEEFHSQHDAIKSQSLPTASFVYMATNLSSFREKFSQYKNRFN